jgi:hypothetical protein
MIDRELTRKQEDWYRWFHERKCGHWQEGDRQCPIMKIQMGITAETAPGHKYYPEAIWGDPRNPIWFMGINPGQEKLGNPASHVAAEREACLNTQSCDQSYEEFRRRHDWVGTYREVRDHYVFADNVTRASLGLLTGTARLVDADDEPVTDTTVSGLTIINMAHCKCPGFGDNFHLGSSHSAARETCAAFWDECGERNLEAIGLWRPKVLVTYGVAPTWWLGDVHLTKQQAGWHVENFPPPDESWLMQHGWLFGPENLKVRLLCLKHPSRNKLNMGEAPRLFQLA